eukprot:SAG22_NODE_970_length_6231_cov_2.345890_7_plen_39_part_01
MRTYSCSWHHALHLLAARAANNGDEDDRARKHAVQPPWN